MNRTFLAFTSDRKHEMMPAFGEHDIRSPEVLVEHFIDTFSTPGDHVFDVFAGLGTTLLVAARRGRVPHGIAFNPRKHAYIRDLLPDTFKDNILLGDARSFDTREFPLMDLCFTSPPYMRATDPEDPLADYQGTTRYEAYLKGLLDVFSRVASMMKPGGKIIIEVSNLKDDSGTVTPLAWDVAREVSQVLHFDGEIVICWDRIHPVPEGFGNSGYGYDHDYCLVFTRE